MIKYTLSDLGEQTTPEIMKEHLLKMLLSFDQFCKENGLTYYLSGGTLLGAIRHKGFIPWDDDIDIFMPRKDFKALQDAISLYSTPYRIEFYDNVKNYGYASPKLVDTRTTLIDYKSGTGREEISVFVDIFLLDGMGEHRITAYLRYYLLKILKRMIFLSRRNFRMESLLKSIVFFLPYLISKCIGTDNISKLYHYFCSKQNFYTSEYVACVAGRYGKAEVLKRRVFEKAVPILFEGKTFWAPCGYDSYLGSLYGNYMAVPPIEKRKSNHSSEEWWKI